MWALANSQSSRVRGHGVLLHRCGCIVSDSMHLRVSGGADSKCNSWHKLKDHVSSQTIEDPLHGARHRHTRFTWSTVKARIRTSICREIEQMSSSRQCYLQDERKSTANSTRMDRDTSDCTWWYTHVPFGSDCTWGYISVFFSWLKVGILKNSDVLWGQESWNVIWSLYFWDFVARSSYPEEGTHVRSCPKWVTSPRKNRSM